MPTFLYESLLKTHLKEDFKKIETLCIITSKDYIKYGIYDNLIRSILLIFSFICGFVFLKYYLINRVSHLDIFLLSNSIKIEKSNYMGKIELKGISKDFNCKCILKNLNYVFYSSNVYLITGQTGVGKTTLLSIISKAVLSSKE